MTTRTVDKFGAVIVMGEDGIGRYVSPFGNPESLSARLAIWEEGLRRDRSLPWVGLGLHADVERAAIELRQLDAVRALLVEKGMLAPGDYQTDVGTLLRILL